MKAPILNFISTIIFIGLLLGCKTQNSDYEKMVQFGQDYTKAWNTLDPEKVVSFYAEDGSLTINHGTPAMGREQLIAAVGAYMGAFPDMHLTMDSMVKGNGTYKYYWTFIGTNTGPNGTGNKVKFSGFEEWTMNIDGLVQTSIGSYDAEDYDRQVKGNTN